MLTKYVCNPGRAEPCFYDFLARSSRREFGFDLALDCVDDNIEAGVRGAKLW
jgi:hypothetical protein